MWTLPFFARTNPRSPRSKGERAVSSVGRDERYERGAISVLHLNTTPLLPLPTLTNVICWGKG